MFGGTIKLNPVGLLVAGFVVVMLLVLFRWNGRANSSLLSSAASSENGDGIVNRRPLTVKRLLVESIVAAERGGLQVTAAHRTAKLNAKHKGLTKEGAFELVTDADLRSHQAIKASLEGAFKDHDIKLVSEEHVADEDNAERTADTSDSSINRAALEATSLLPDGPTLDATDVTVWIDPLDATQEFTEDLLEYVTVLVCVAIHSKPVVGVVHRPFKPETFWAWSGQGRSVNLRAYQETDMMAAAAANSTRTIIVSRSHAGSVADTAKAAFGENVKIIAAGGAGHKVLQVIQGKADAYVHVTRIKKWDICAGNALLDALGGRMTTLAGQNIEYGHDSGVANDNGLLATLYSHKKYLKAMSQP